MTDDPHRSFKPKIWRRGTQELVVLDEIIAMSSFGDYELMLTMRNGKSIRWTCSATEGKKTRDEVFSSLAAALEMFHSD